MRGSEPPVSLTEQQATFCSHYAQNQNGAHAFAHAYPWSRSKRPKARSEYARRLLRKPWILAKVADLRNESRADWCARAEPQQASASLNGQQVAFCEHYAQNANGARAYAAAYPDSRALGSNVLSERARRLLRKPCIVDRISHLRGEMRSDVCSATEPPAQVLPVVTADAAAPTQAAADLERLALVAFDERQADVVRLAALRRLDAGLAALAGAASADKRAPTIRVEVFIEMREASEDRAPAPPAESFEAMFLEARQSSDEPS
ncbi:MAG: hypothetical protein K8F92_16350 [Hyphomicrobium sp.]|uniref:hypothetical protein n=1 Tax=Hyphomicrobium sp. TaxID=82 RepID=UPI001328454A|nr:hypothetical protein [Hyphomicrobium sp.]KAB2942952.1 MAG: hypothetical protein F9K20_05685 [Hyphomicrobium sp.]MBZ0211203.1 hypothetical protein [Hyphomicrobium sp.]